VSSLETGALTRPNDRLWRRRFVNRGMELVAWLAAAVGIAILGVVVYSVARRAAPALNLDLFTKSPVPFAAPNVKQGLATAFVGSIVIVGIATAMALPFGILVAIYVNEFAPRRVKKALGLVLDVLNGIPSIVIGIFVFGLIVLRFRQSGLAASFALAIIMLPLVARSAIEVLALVPNSLREAGLGLGAPRWRTTLGVVLPQAVGGMLTGTTLAVARGGEHGQLEPAPPPRHGDVRHLHADGLSIPLRPRACLGGGAGPPDLHLLREPRRPLACDAEPAQAWAGQQMRGES
jgi:phosphate transport system permease protein